jgi:hypothetical protein
MDGWVAVTGGKSSRWEDLRLLSPCQRQNFGRTIRRDLIKFIGAAPWIATCLGSTTAGFELCCVNLNRRSAFDPVPVPPLLVLLLGPLPFPPSLT